MALVELDEGEIEILLHVLPAHSQACFFPHHVAGLVKKLEAARREITQSQKEEEP